MTVPSTTSLLIAQQELTYARSDPRLESVTLSELNKEALTLTAEMRSEIDQERYILKIQFDNYKEWPPLLEFIDPSTEQEGTKHAYPQCDDSFFYGSPCICNPCSRKSYDGYSGVHSSWDLVGWKQNPKVSGLTNFRAILLALHFRIKTKQYYKGRMA